MKLLIVESPGKCKKLKSILGDDWIVEASVGHVRDLPLRSLGVDVDYKPCYEATERGVEVIKKLRVACNNAEVVYLATDPDREGEAIAWHLKEALGLKNYHRITFTEINKEAVLPAFKAARQIDMQMVHAQEARRVLDRLIGYKVSNALNRNAGTNNLTAGRVQSIAVRVIVERERAIRNFVVTNHFGAEVSFEEKWTAQWNTKPFLKPDSDYILDKVLAEKAAACRDFTIISSEKKSVLISPPAPFTTSTLQQDGFKSLGFDVDLVMQIAQSLYQQGFITYHRTDTPSIGIPAMIAVQAYLVEQGKPVHDKHRTWKAKDGAQEAHEACRPSDISLENAGSTEDEQRLYKLIRSRTLACQSADAVYSDNILHLQSGDFEFIAKGRTLISGGWKTIYTEAEEDKDKLNPHNPVPLLDNGAYITAISGRVLAKKTAPPSRYDQASLVKKLESEAIGRPSTYAQILKNILSREHVGVNLKKQFIPTEQGEILHDALVGHFAFYEMDYTRDLEQKLDDILGLQNNYFSVVSTTDLLLNQQIEQLETSIVPQYPCPKCNKALNRIKGPTGFFWGCSAYKNGCKHSQPDNNGKPGEKEPEKIYPCPICTKPLRRIKNKDKDTFFWGCTGYAEGCKHSQPDDNGKPDSKPKVTSLTNTTKFSCKICSKPLTHKKKEGANGFNFWGCSGYPVCKQTYKDNNGKPAF